MFIDQKIWNKLPNGCNAGFSGAGSKLSLHQLKFFCKQTKPILHCYLWFTESKTAQSHLMAKMDNPENYVPTMHILPLETPNNLFTYSKFP